MSKIEVLSIISQNLFFEQLFLTWSERDDFQTF